MANEGNESRIGRMDLNLYLGLPRSPRRPSSLADLGSDLALGSLPLSSSTATGESSAPAEMSGAVEQSDPHAPYSPSHASYNPDLPSIDPLHSAAGGNPVQEYTPYEPYALSGVPLLPITVELEGPDDPYSPPQALPTVQENDELHPDAYDLVSPRRLADRASPGEPDAPYLPTYSPFSEVGFGLYRSLRGRELLAREDGSSSRQDLLQLPEFRFGRQDLLRLPEFRFGRFIEVNPLRRQFRMSPPNDDERSNFDRPSSPTAEQLVRDIMSSQRELEANGKHGAPTKCVAVEGSDEETKVMSRNGANFECNICLDMAMEPVVTSCGHLFCWPCLYQWLYLHSDHKECPVCKGEVIESNITPIYGRGSSESGDEKKLGKNEESGLKIPPRPRGNRLESFRQHFRPISRRFGEGITTSWRRHVDQRLRNRNNGDPSLQGIYDGGHRTPLTRMRARRMQREEGIPESGPISREIGLPRDSLSIPQSSSSSLLFRDGIDLWRGFHSLSSSERLAAMAAGLNTMVGGFAGSSNRYAASTSSVNPPAPELPIGRPPAPASSAADQASASSTMAVIQGDVAVTDATLGPNSAGSSRSHRRRGRSSTSGSLDVDGGALHARKRRRLN